MGGVIALSYFTVKGKKNLLAVSVFIRLFTESVEIELINISVRHLFGPYATCTHFKTLQSCIIYGDGIVRNSTVNNLFCCQCFSKGL